MNVHDSERMHEALQGAGYSLTDDSSLANVIVFNTCSIREKAEQKLLSMLGRFRWLRESRSDLTLVVAGCVAQQEGDKLLRRMPYVDIIVGPDNIGELPALIRHVQDGGGRLSRTVFDLQSPQFLQAMPSHDHSGAPRHSAFVTIMKGCDERCSYCIVPTTRGPERYRARDEILREVASLVQNGVREITLLGQTVNSWVEPGTVVPSGTTGGSYSEFPSLLRSIAERVPGLSRLRYTSPHPRHVTAELVAAHRDLDVLAAHVHLPVQSGSDRVLKRMIRRYTHAQYVEAARALQQARASLGAGAEVTLSTDIIVGFPGETEQDFEDTVRLVQEVGFVSAFVFKYSPRPFTPSLKLEDDVPEEEKDRRMARLFDVVDAQQRSHLQSLVGTEQEVLLEGRSPTVRDNGLAGDPEAVGSPVPSETTHPSMVRMVGRTGRNEIVHVDVPAPQSAQGHGVGSLVRVRIEQANKHSLHASMLGIRSAPHACFTMKVEESPKAPSRVRLPVMRETKELQAPSTEHRAEP
jgi:tRNA-2-methylthio-N6-dimethylallyladenosine synthase